MNRPPTSEGVLFIGREGPWRFRARRGDNPVDLNISGETPETRAAELTRQTAEAGLGAGRILLALDSPLCLCGQVSSAGLPRSGRRAMLAYRLEEKLPLSAEDLTADYLDAGTGHLLGIAVETTPLQFLLGALEGSGWQVVHVVPAALLAADEILAHQADPPGRLLLAFAHPPDRLDYTGGQIRRWTRSGLDDTLPAEGFSSFAPIIAAGPAALWQGFLPPGTSPETIQALTESPEELATRAGLRLLRGQGTPPIDFRRDGLADGGRTTRRQSAALAVWAAALLLATAGIGTLLYRAEQYRALARNAYEEARPIYKDILPDRLLPSSLAAIENDLERELHRRRGLRGLVEDVPRHQSMLETLRTVIAALPSTVRYRILDLRLEQDRIDLEGQVRQHGDAEILAEALRQKGFGVEAPRTRQVDEKRVEFTLFLQPAGKVTVSR